MKTLLIWWKALRFHFTSLSTLPALLGVVLALHQESSFNGRYFILLLAALLCHHFALNMADDYFDFKQGADSDQNSTPYAGGSGVLLAGDMLPKTMNMAFLILYGITIGIGLYFVSIRGWFILALGLVGIFSSYYYTAPPIKLCHRGLGELTIFLNFGPLIVMGSYYLQTQTISLESLLLGLSMGAFICAIVLFNEIPDALTDASVGKKTLIVRFGKTAGFHLIIVNVILTYLMILYCSYACPLLLLSFIGLPWAYKAIVLLKQTLNTEHILGNHEMMKAHDVTTILLILAYSIQVSRDGKPLSILLFILSTLLVLYLPVLFQIPHLSLAHKK